MEVYMFKDWDMYQDKVIQFKFESEDDGYCVSSSIDRDILLNSKHLLLETYGNKLK